MLQIKTTPNLYGITLSGDFQDLNGLYDSISRYLSFYMSQMGEGYPYHEYEYLLSLNYDIRHAYMGDRDFIFLDNNAENVGVHAETIFELPEEAKKKLRNVRRSSKTGNLYFSVNILYPLVFHYLLAFENLLLDEPDEEIFENITDENEPWMEKYTYFDAMTDQSTIRYFCALLWKNIQDLLGKDPASAVYKYFIESDFLFPLSIYCDVLLHCQMRSFPVFSESDKLNFLELAFYELIDSDDLHLHAADYPTSFARYKDCRNNLNRKGEFPVFPEKRLFFDLLEKAFPPGTPLYENKFDTFLEQTYGTAGDEEPEW